MARYTNNEVDCVRRLAGEVMAIACSSRMAGIRKRWRDVNELRIPDRAPVWCKPVGCWSELLPEDSLYCSDPVLRDIEWNFRRILIKDGIGDDSIVNPWYNVQRAFDVEPPNYWGVDVVHHSTGSDGGAWGYNAPICSADDLGRLRMPGFRYNEVGTAARYEAVQSALGGEMPVRLRCGGAFAQLLSPTIGTVVADLLGMTGMMLMMLTEPETVHAVTRLVADAVRESDDYLLANGLLDRNNDEPMSFSDDFGPAPGADGVLSHSNLWCAVNSQEYDQVSPDMWREFCLNYQKPLLSRYGRVIYGCCENLTHKLDGVLEIPNLHVLVCSAWTSLDVVLDRTGAGHVIMWRQKASDVVMPLNAAT